MKNGFEPDAGAARPEIEPSKNPDFEPTKNPEPQKNPDIVPTVK